MVDSEKQVVEQLKILMKITKNYLNSLGEIKMTKTKQTKLFKTKKIRKYRRKPVDYKLLYVGTRKQMYDLKNTKGRFLPRKDYCVRKHFRHFGLFRKVQ